MFLEKPPKETSRLFFHQEILNMPCQRQMPSKDSGLEPQPCDRQDRYPGMFTWKLTASLPSLLPTLPSP